MKLKEGYVVYFNVHWHYKTVRLDFQKTFDPDERDGVFAIDHWAAISLTKSQSPIFFEGVGLCPKRDKISKWHGGGGEREDFSWKGGGIVAYCAWQLWLCGS